MTALFVIVALLWPDLAHCGERRAQVAATLDPKLGRIVARCKRNPHESPAFWIFKQWHADARLSTRDRAQAKTLPQNANQTALYRQLDAWAAKGALKTLVAEGCSEPELTRASGTRYNGWTVEELVTESKRPHYDDEVLASVAQKVEARYGDQVKTLCGDDDALVRDHQLAFSDLRGTLGFFVRLIENEKNPSKRQHYLDGVIELYKLPKDTAYEVALKRLSQELKKGYARLKVALGRRNERVVAALTQAGAGTVTVYGGLHAVGILELLDAKGVSCAVVEPTGYQNDDVALVSKLEGILKSLD